METENSAKKRHQRRTAAERAEVVEQFQLSGLTRKAFSQTQKIALSTLSKWLMNAKHRSIARPPLLFREVTVPFAPPHPAVPWAVEIVAPDGVTVRCREALPMAELAWLLRGR